MLIEAPNADPFHSEDTASSFGNHSQRFFEIFRIDRITLCQLAQRNLLLFQCTRPLSFGVFDVLTFGNIFRNAQQILGHAIVAVDRDFPGMEQPLPISSSFDGFFRNVEAISALQYFAVQGREKVGFLLGEKIIVTLADKLLSGITEQLFPRLVEAHKLERLGILDKDHVRNIFNDGGQERLIASHFFCSSLAFGNVPVNAAVSSEPAGTIEQGHPSAFKDDTAAIFMEVDGLNAAKRFPSCRDGAQ